MTTPTWSQWMNNELPEPGLTAEDMSLRQAAAAFVLSSGQNPDGTPFALPVSGAVTATPSGTTSVQGTGTAGAPAGGVLTVQGASGGTAIPVASAGVGAGAVAPSAANILVGYQAFTATTAATTVITIPANRTWVGSVTISAAVAVAAASTSNGSWTSTVAVAGTGVTPAAGTVGEATAYCGSNGATGTVGTGGNATVTIPLTVAAPVGNAVTVTLATALTGSVGRGSCTASGILY